MNTSTPGTEVPDSAVKERPASRTLVMGRTCQADLVLDVHGDEFLLVLEGDEEAEEHGQARRLMSREEVRRIRDWLEDALAD